MTNGCTEIEAGTVGEAVGHRLDRGVSRLDPKRARAIAARLRVLDRGLIAAYEIIDQIRQERAELLADPSARNQKEIP